MRELDESNQTRFDQSSETKDTHYEMENPPRHQPTNRVKTMYEKS